MSSAADFPPEPAGNVKPAPAWLYPPRVERMLAALDAQDEVKLLRQIGLSDREMASLIRFSADIGLNPVAAAREMIRCSMAVMEGRR